MGAIESYTNTKLEMMADEHRLHLLLLEKESLYQKYVGVHSIAYSDEPKVAGSGENKNIAYIMKCDEINPQTGMSLNQEIGFLQGNISIRKQALNDIEAVLEQLKGMEYELYRLIVISGYKPSRAVRIIADKYAYSEKAIWEKPYQIIKPEIKKIRRLKQVVSKW